MFGNIFYHNTIRKAVIAFGTIFNDIWVVRKTASNTEQERFKVPLNYGPRERFLTRLKDDPTLNRPIDILLPRLSFQIVSFNYAGNRKLNTMGKNFKIDPTDNSRLSRVFNGVTYDLGMELSVMTKNVDDGNQIVEQILPWFTPDYTPTIHALPELNLTDDLPIVLTTVQMNDTYDDEWKERRNILWTLNFNVKTTFYGPVKDQKIITHTQSDILVPPGATDLEDPAQRSTVPRIRRHEIDPDPLNAFKGDDFGYTETITDFDDGKRYNPVTDTDDDIT